MLQFKTYTYQGLETHSKLNLENAANVNFIDIIKKQPLFNHRLHI